MDKTSSQLLYPKFVEKVLTLLCNRILSQDTLLDQIVSIASVHPGISIKINEAMRNSEKSEFMKEF